MNENKEFTPLAIGLPNMKREQAIVKVYTEICERADALLLLFQWFLSEESDLKLFFDFLNSKNPREFLYLRFIEINKITFPGLSIEKIMQFDLVDVPKEDFEELLMQRKQLLESIKKTDEDRFYFPLKKLYYNDGNGIEGFQISNQSGNNERAPEFDELLFNKVRVWTISEKENQVLEVINKAINALNDLVQQDIIRNDTQRWKIDMEDFIQAIEFSLKTDRPLSLYPLAHKIKGLRKHFEPRPFGGHGSGSTLDILRYEDSVPVQTEYVTENLPEPEDLETGQIESQKEEVIQTE